MSMIRKAIQWMLSFLILFFGFVSLFSDGLSGLLLIAAGGVLLPPILNKLRQISKDKTKWIIPIISLILIMSYAATLPAEHTDIGNRSITSANEVSPVSSSTTWSSSVPVESARAESTLLNSTAPVPVIVASENDEKSSSHDTMLKIHFLDVGQADCILVQSGALFALIDAGNNADSGIILQYLKSLGIRRFEYVVGTHPHEDHIGSLDTIINTYDIGKIIMPKVQATTNTFEDLLDSITAKGLKVTTPLPGSIYNLGDVELQILAPNSSSYEETNDFSVVSRIVFGNTSFLLTGDAESVSEQEMINKGYALQADVLKVGHHGSTSSTTTAFLSKVKPTYAVICVGADNTYGHPSSSILQRLNNAGVTVYRTDIYGTVVITSDGQDLYVVFEKDANTYAQAPPPTAAVSAASPTSSPAMMYIGNKNTKKFHKPTCGSLPNPENQVALYSRDEAINLGFTPCGICKP